MGAVSARTTHRSRRAVLAALAAAAFATPLHAQTGTSTGATDATAARGGLKIGIVGAGNVGSALGRLWIKAGHQVMFSSRHPETLREMADALGPAASVGTPAQAAAFGDVVLVAVPYGAIAEVGQELAPVWRGKVVIDAGNAVARRDGDAIADDVARRGIGVVARDLLPGVRVVRAFSSLPAGKYTSEGFREPRVGMPLAGDDAQAVQTVERLIRDMGFEPVMVGGLDRARLFQQREAFWAQAQKDLPADELRRLLPP